MVNYSLISLLVFLVAYVRQSYINYTFQIGGATIAATGYFAHAGIHQAQAIKNTCHGNWRHAKVNGLECSFALSQTMAWHTFVITLGAAGGTVAETYVAKAQRLSQQIPQQHMQHEMIQPS